MRAVIIDFDAVREERHQETPDAFGKDLVAEASIRHDFTGRLVAGIMQQVIQHVTVAETTLLKKVFSF